MQPEKRPPSEAQVRARIFAVGIGVVGGAAGSLAVSPLIERDFTSYGSLLFIGIPLLLGFVVTAISRLGGELSYGMGVALTLITTLGMGFGMLFSGAEGVICLLMAMPIAIPGILAGVGLGMMVPARGPMLGIVILPLGALALADRAAPREFVSEVNTSIEVNASPERVWDEVLALDTLPPPTDPFLRTGVACPVKTEIRGSGVGAERHCTLTTGAMPERITAWEPGRRLTFVALETPPMLKEVNPFRETHPPHLRGYYRVLRGDFILEPLPGGRTRLSRGTRFAHRFGPSFYWTPWCNFGAERAHRYVLEVVKAKAEANRVATN